MTQSEMEINLKMHKAISIIQFKAEGQIIKRHPEFCLDRRNLLHRIDYEKGTIDLDGNRVSPSRYELSDD